MTEAERQHRIERLKKLMETFDLRIENRKLQIKDLEEMKNKLRVTYEELCRHEAGAGFLYTVCIHCGKLMD